MRVVLEMGLAGCLGFGVSVDDMGACNEQQGCGGRFLGHICWQRSCKLLRFLS